MIETRPASETRVMPVRSAVGPESWEPGDLVAELRDAGLRAEPFAESSLAFCAALSRQLMDLRQDPDAVSLGYWLRPASLARLQASLAATTPERAITAARGLAFHVTPGNVETVFVYSWILSLLAGNANIVRLASDESEARSRLLGAVERTLQDDRFGDLAARNRIVTTGHDDDVTRQLSAACDVRIIWGGDATVTHFRRFPIPPRAHEIVFPDRHSLALLDARRVAEVPDDELARLADAFFRDAFWHDQGACSSPRLVIWRVEPGDRNALDPARQRLRGAVAAALQERGYVAETGMAINKMVAALERAASSDGVRIERDSNEATWVRLPDVSAYDRASCGGGLFFEVESDDLAADLLRFARPEDQTAICFGLTSDEVRHLARRLNGQGLDRFVDVGQALAFDALWDGMDLLHELTRLVVVDVGS